jgi:hypothetical protein
MSSKGGNPYGDYEFLRAAMVQKEETERGHDVVVTTTISLRRSPCVLLVRVEAKEARAKDADRPLCSYEVEWPNAGTVGWCATLFQAYVKLDRLVEDSRTDAGLLETSYRL